MSKTPKQRLVEKLRNGKLVEKLAWDSFAAGLAQLTRIAIDVRPVEDMILPIQMDTIAGISFPLDLICDPDGYKILPR